MNRKYASRSRVAGLALFALATLAVLCVSAFEKQNDYAGFTEFTFCPYGDSELTKATFRSRFWDTEVALKGTRVLSETFRLNTIKGDQEEGIARNAESSYTVLKQLNICPA